MSTLKVNAIRGTGASSDAISVNSTDGTCTANLTNPRSFRNLLINGDCLIDQRNGGSSVTTGFAIDRTQIEGFDGGGTGTGQQVSDGPSGFTKSLKITVTGTDTSLASTDFYTLRQIIEGQNVSFLGFGASGGTSVTLSFWVKSSLTGTFSCSIGNGGNDRSYPKTYTISSADTWEKKTLTFPAATDGTWGTDNGRGIAVRWSLGAGTGRLGTADQWNSSQAHGATGTTNLFATNGATFFITGLQLEAGSVATDFEHRSYGDELTRCQRYCFVQTVDNLDYTGFICAAITPNDALCTRAMPVPMRTIPSYTGTETDVRVKTGADNSNTQHFDDFTIDKMPTTPSPAIITLRYENMGGMTAGQCGHLQSLQNNGKLIFSAEL